ncbi:MAG TPA: alpha-L-fucosidase [Parafilimonas sp.]|nr:alpha-L-fucosidase [Parafilimonas sp.]
MNLRIITFIVLLYSSALYAQTASPDQKTGEIVLPAEHAVVLYADQVSDTTGKNKFIASHWSNVGGGTFTWSKEIVDEDDYDMALSYFTNSTNTTAKISFNNHRSIAVTLQPTSGYYPQKKDWYQFNCERRRLPGKIHLQKGSNNISLQLATSSPDAETILFALELTPVNAAKSMEDEKKRLEKLRPNTNWFANIPYGVMFHWTSQSAPESGAKKTYSDAVKDFNVTAFVDMVVKTGAGYVILTTNHAEPYFPAPLKEWEKIYPGHTTQRDLIEEIADGLAKHNIKLFLYMATHIYAKYDSVNDEEFQKLNNTLVGEIAARYKKKVAGFWFDGWYQCYEKHPDFNFGQFYKICKTGNEDRLICLNSWLYPIVSWWQDYWAGEVYTIGDPPKDQILKNGPGTGLQTHNLIVMETEDWLHTKLNTKIPSPHLNANDLIDFISKSKGKGPVTINIQIYQEGKISDEALAVMEQVKKAFH